MKKPPNMQSWATLRSRVRRSSEQDILYWYTQECDTFRRKYIIIRLIGAYLSKVRTRLKKEAKIK